MNSLYIEGTIRVPLSALAPHKETLAPTADLTTLLQNPEHLLAGIVSAQARDAVLRTLGWNLDQLRAASQPPLVTSHVITCMGSATALQQAISDLGGDHVCNIQLYCIPR